MEYDKRLPPVRLLYSLVIVFIIQNKVTFDLLGRQVDLHCAQCHLGCWSDHRHQDLPGLSWTGPLPLWTDGTVGHLHLPRGDRVQGGAARLSLQ